MPRRLLAPLVTSVLAFQSHWLDDAGSGSADAAGILVSLTGSALLAGGWVLGSRAAGRWVLTAGWVFIAYISVADLAGLDASGALAPSLVEHWRTRLGPAATAAVTIAGLAALTGLVQLWRAPRAAAR